MRDRLGMIGIFGGSGFYSLLDDAQSVDKETPFGSPSSPVTIGTIGGKEVAFIARHGLSHEFPPHRIPYKANIYAFKELGVKRIIAPTSVGSLNRQIEPGHFVVPDQFVNFTKRDDTFYEERPVTHISMSEPYCPHMRDIVLGCAKTMGIHMHSGGTSVIIEGPRFSTKAESAFYKSQNWDIVNMTQYPEVALARELEMCYLNISIVTDYDAGIKDDPQIKPVSLDQISRVFAQNNEKLKNLIFEMIPKLPEIRTCVCCHALEGSRF
jgi:5'-methylthioadenosine phosphorylase